MSASIDQIFHTGLLDLPCHRLLEVQCLKLRKPLVCLSPVAKMHIVNYTLNIVKSLCDATAPSCIGDIIQCIDYCFPEKLKPSPQFLDEVQSQVEKGKRKTLYISADKVFSCFKVTVVRPILFVFSVGVSTHGIKCVLVPDTSDGTYYGTNRSGNIAFKPTIS